MRPPRPAFCILRFASYELPLVILKSLAILEQIERRALPRATAVPFVIAQFVLRTESLAAFGTPVLFGHAETPNQNLCADCWLHEASVAAGLRTGNR